MGSREKAKQFLEASQAHTHYSSVIGHALTYFISAAEKEDPQLAEGLQKVMGEFAEPFAQAIGVTEEVYCDLFTDEEMDNLIVIHRNPALEKLRGLTSEIFDKILTKLASQSK